MTQSKTIPFLAVSVAALMAAQGVSAQNAPSPTAQELTRALNTRPPQATTVPAAAPAVTQAPARRPAPVASPVTSPVTSPAPAARTTAPAQSRVSVRSRPAVATSAPAQAQIPAQIPAQAPAAAPRIMPLGRAAIEALPFRLDLMGAQIVERPAGPSAKVYSVRRGDTPLLMIYTGPQSDYPIYGGDQAEVAGRVSIVVTEGLRRRAVEHLFRREDKQPADIHVWLMAMEGADGDLAEQIAQTVDPR